MGDINDKLDYLETTKSLIKQAIEDKGVAVSDSDTFRSYATKISSIPSGGMDMINDVATVVTDDYFDNLMTMITDQGGELTDSNKYVTVDYLQIPLYNGIQLPKQTAQVQSFGLQAFMTEGDMNRFGAVYASDDFGFYNWYGNAKVQTQTGRVEYTQSKIASNTWNQITVNSTADKFEATVNGVIYYTGSAVTADFSSNPFTIGAYTSNGTSLNDYQPMYIKNIIATVGQQVITYMPVYNMATNQFGLMNTNTKEFYGGFESQNNNYPILGGYGNP